jgi:hypothetical protein
MVLVHAGVLSRWFSAWLHHRVDMGRGQMSRVQQVRELLNEALLTCTMSDEARALLKQALRLLKSKRRKTT